MMATVEPDQAEAPPCGEYVFCSGGQFRLMEIRDAASAKAKKKWDSAPAILHEGEGNDCPGDIIMDISKDNLPKEIRRAKRRWLSDQKLSGEHKDLHYGIEECLEFPFTAKVWLPDDTTVKAKVTGFIEGEDGSKRPGTGIGFKVTYLDQELLVPTDAFVDELADPDQLDDDWMHSGEAVPAKVFAVLREFYDGAIFTNIRSFGDIWCDLRYDVGDEGFKKEKRKVTAAMKKDYISNPPKIKKIKSFPKVDTSERLWNVHSSAYPLMQMSLAFHTYLASLGQFPFEVKLKYGGGIVTTTGMVPYKANKYFQESRGVYVTIDLPSASGEPPSKKSKNCITKHVAMSVHGVEACDSTPDPVKRYLEDIDTLMGYQGLCVDKWRFEQCRLLPKDMYSGGWRY
ncbi:uncharacterized protein LOC118404727 isoform X2 [Branchiostoma floridae]|uniref:Uncharacterized protein LOC118404727 isoform X1 n=1 Tax=Branchiostoma floridae TaxID=7739 RepID=A0A9J7HKP5_BRAFL|nr:uncharacterized protein LOC118404727 isoform X1 [Branchiostoma floridae]XP_035659893.1 uncharacterized protein LOC118404727 isoform X2 [Branchiostoma floridae]